MSLFTFMRYFVLVLKMYVVKPRQNVEVCGLWIFCMLWVLHTVHLSVEMCLTHPSETAVVFLVQDEGRAQRSSMIQLTLLLLRIGHIFQTKSGFISKFTRFSCDRPEFEPSINLSRVYVETEWWIDFGDHKCQRTVVLHIEVSHFYPIRKSNQRCLVDSPFSSCRELFCKSLFYKCLELPLP